MLQSLLLQSPLHSRLHTRLHSRGGLWGREEPGARRAAEDERRRESWPEARREAAAAEARSAQGLDGRGWALAATEGLWPQLP